jgi:ABC-type phosphate transport system substrate-binding protein
MPLPTRLLAALLLAVAAVPTAADDAPGYRLIVHPASKVEALSRREVIDLFLKRTTTWPTGGAVHPVEPPEDAAVRERFGSEVLGKSAAALKSYWNKRIFAGREVPPVEKRSDEEVVAFVRTTPGAVGYVSGGAAVAGVKVVKLKD